MTTPKVDPDPATPSTDPEALKETIREILEEVLPDFLTPGESAPKPDDVDDLDKPLTARSAETMMKGLMKSAMEELQQKKPPPPPKAKPKTDEPPAPDPEKEDPPKPPAKKFSLAKMLWGEE